MKKLSLYIGLFIYILYNPLSAKEVDCRNLSSKHSSQCDTYGAKLLYNVKASDPTNRKKLITSKTLPVPKKEKLKIITVDNLIEEHIKINEPIRYTKEFNEKDIKYVEENKTKEPKEKPKKPKETDKAKKDRLIHIIENWGKDPSIVPVKKTVKKTKKKIKKVIEKKERKKQAKKKSKQEKYKFLKRTYKNKLRVLATAYTSHRSQTDSTPFLAAWNNRIRPGMKIIAVSRDLIRKYGLRNGSKVKISGLKGTYVVRDKMNKRFKKKIDIYMGTNKRRALRWGRRYVTIYW